MRRQSKFQRPVVSKDFGPLTFVGSENTMMPLPNQAIPKKDLRALMKARRAEASTVLPQAGGQLRDLVMQRLSLPPKSVIASYSPSGGEIDPGPLAEALRREGHVIVLPVIAERGHRLLFRRYAVGDPLTTNSFGIAEPLPAAELLEPSILFVPLLAFDRRRHRLGYGGGYYDRTLAALRKLHPLTAIGFAFSCQEIQAIPEEKHDEALDVITTELEIF